MFLGEIKQAIDEKGGLRIPNQFLLELASGMVVTRGFDQNLMLFRSEEWQRLANKILNQPLSHPQSRNLRRRIFSNAVVLKVDDRNRIQLPSELCDFAGLNGEVVFTGMFDYIEIWNIQIWQVIRSAINAKNNGGVWETIGV